MTWTPLMKFDVPEGREAEYLEWAKDHLFAVRYRPRFSQDGMVLKATGRARKMGWPAAILVALLFIAGLFFIVFLLLGFLGVIVYVVVYRPDRIEIRGYAGELQISYKGEDAFRQAQAIKQKVEAG